MHILCAFIIINKLNGQKLVDSEEVTNNRVESNNALDFVPDPIFIFFTYIIAQPFSNRYIFVVRISLFAVFAAFI